MKKAIQILLSGGYRIITCATAIGMTLLVIGSVLSLSGCQKAAESTTDSAHEVTGVSPFNTLTGTEEWGDEADFLRIVDMTDKTDEFVVGDFRSGQFTLGDERLYAAVAYLHNTSDQPRQNVVVTLSCPDIIMAEQDNQLEVLLGWDGEDSGFISDTLTLNSTVDLTLSSVVNDGDMSMALIRGDDGKLSKTPLLVSSVDNVTAYMIVFDEIESDETCMVFFPFESLPAVR